MRCCFVALVPLSTLGAPPPTPTHPSLTSTRPAPSSAQPPTYSLAPSLPSFIHPSTHPLLSSAPLPPKGVQDPAHSHGHRAGPVRRCVPGEERVGPPPGVPRVEAPPCADRGAQLLREGDHQQACPGDQRLREVNTHKPTHTHTHTQNNVKQPTVGGVVRDFQHVINMLLMNERGGLCHSFTRVWVWFAGLTKRTFMCTTVIHY